MSADRPNRIEVDLRLIQDENLKLLQEFSDKFSQAVEKLDDIARRGLGIETPTTEVVKETSSTPQAVQEAARPRITEPLNVERDVRASASMPGSPWEPPPGLRGRIISATYGSLPGPYGANEWERAQFALGQLQPGIISGLQYTSFLIGQHLARFEDPTRWRRDAEGQLEYAGRMWAATLSGVLGGLARFGIYGQNVLRQASRFLPWIPAIMPYPDIFNQMAQIGVSTGEYNIRGILGTPLFSPAWRRGVREQFDAWSRSRILEGSPFLIRWTLGLLPDPNYTREQALEAQALMRQYGWGEGDIRDIGLDLMERFTRRYRGAIPQEIMMQFLDPLMRFGVGSINNVNNALESLARSARAANMNLEAFAQQVSGAAQSVNAQTGMSITGATQAISNISGITGLGPQVSADLLSNPLYQWLASGMSGVPLGTIVHDPSSAPLIMEAFMGTLGGLGDPERWRGFKWGRPIGEQTPEHQAMVTHFTILRQSGIIPQSIDLSSWLNVMRRSLETGQTPAQALQASITIERGIEESTRVLQQRERLQRRALNRGLAGISAEEWRRMHPVYRRRRLDEIVSQRAFDALGRYVSEAGYGEVWGALEQYVELQRSLGRADFDAIKEDSRYARMAQILAPYKDLIEMYGGVDDIREIQQFAQALVKDKWGDVGDKIARETIEITVKQPYDEMFEALIKNSDNAANANSRKWFARRSSSLYHRVNE